MPRLAILEYVVGPDTTHVLLIKQGFDQPLIFEARDERGGVPRRMLELCAARLLIDFHGLPGDWDLEPNPALREALGLTPAVPAAKRNKAVLERNLAIPGFHYEMDYWTGLGSRLFPAPLRPHLEDCEVLLVIPHGPLHALPFAALRWGENQYLVERFGLAHAPSLSVLRQCRARSARRTRGGSSAPQSALAAAIAAANDTNPATFEADAERLAEICRTESPATRVVRMTGPKPEDGRLPASKTGIVEEAPAHELIHFACHGVFGGDQSFDPLDSGLLFSDGEKALSLADAAAMTPQARHRWILSARDIFALRLRADLVTLRACSSGRSARQSGDELVGLTRAVLYAGAASLIVSLWNVNQKSSQLLLSAFYETWLKPEPADGCGAVAKWKALQQAQIELLRHGYAHPFHFAPFILVGDWA
jgi:CHAT domain-containing protein